MTDKTWQDTIALYLDAEFCHSAGDYKAAVKLLADAQAAAPAKSGDGLPQRFDAIVELARKLNNRLLKRRYTAHHEYRHPPSPGDLFRVGGNSRTFDYIHSFYAVGIEALTKASEDEDKLWTLRRAIVRNYGNPIDPIDPESSDRIAKRIAERIAERFTHRTAFAQQVLHCERDSKQILASEIRDFLNADVKDHDEVPAFVLGAFFQAHINRYAVENRRSVPVGKTLARSKKGGLEKDGDLLKQAVALLTFTIAICLNYPWLFAADGGERRDLQPAPPDPNDEVHAGEPGSTAASKAAWLARQVLLLSIYRRAHIFRLLGEHQRSYNDLRKVQRMSRETRLPLSVNDPKNKNLNTLIMLAEFRIGELYRADHDAAQGLVHLCRSHDLVNAWQRYAGVNESALFQVHISLGKGKAFLEIGAIKRALKWYVRAWVALERLVGTEHPAGDPELVAALQAHVERSRNAPKAHLAEITTLLARVEQPSDNANPVAALDAYLTRIKHAPEIDKAELRRYLDPTIERLSADLPDHHYDALAADVLVRIAHVLLVLRLEEDGRSRYAETLLGRATKLDHFNLLAWSGLLRCELRGMHRDEVDAAPDAMDCWPSGARDVDQAIRVGEYLMLKRVRDGRQEQSTAAGEGEAPEPPDAELDSINANVARELLNHFHTHTDSINLRLGIMHRYLMKARADDKRELDELLGGRAPDERALEFVCLRRYGSFHPLMPRPAAVSAVGGGYLIRAFAANGTEPRAFNVLVDPGDGVISNLYRAGLAISDVDMVIVTHDHPDHLTALDAILSLRHERGDSLPHAPINQLPEKQADARRRDAALLPVGDDGERMLILGNESVVNRYSFLNGGGEYAVLHIKDASAQRCPQLLRRSIRITALPTKHLDLGSHHAVGFVLELLPPDEGKGEPLRITIMSDTAFDGLQVQDPKTKLWSITDLWREALRSEIVVAHVSDTPSGEMRELAGFCAADADKSGFDTAVNTLLTNGRKDEAMQLMHALSLFRAKREQPPLRLFESGFLDTMKDWEHLLLHGLLAVAKEMARNDDEDEGEARMRVLVVGELREQLGSFRGTIAREINRSVFQRPPPAGVQTDELSSQRPVVLTSDIGLRIRIAEDGHKVHCSTCALNNDRLASERYHPPEEIHEVCVKGDQEAMYWNCDTHDPSRRRSKVFVEQMGSYDTFTAGGGFHG